MSYQTALPATVFRWRYTAVTPAECNYTFPDRYEYLKKNFFTFFLLFKTETVSFRFRPVDAPRDRVFSSPRRAPAPGDPPRHWRFLHPAPPEHCALIITPYTRCTRHTVVSRKKTSPNNNRWGDPLNCSVTYTVNDGQQHVDFDMHSRRAHRRRYHPQTRVRRLVPFHRRTAVPADLRQRTSAKRLPFR